MRKTTIAVLSISALTLAAPVGALAAHHHATGRHHAAHHSSRVRHAARRHLIRVGAIGAAAGSTGTTGTSGTTGTTGTTSTTGPVGTIEPVGTVTSFSAEVLTITLTDGTVLTGKVTSRTDVGCLPPPGAEGRQGEDDGPDGQGSNEGGASGTNAGRGDFHASAIRAQDGMGEEGDDSEDEGEQAACSTSLLPGAKVAGAELAIGPSGTVWDRVELVG
jgi:hypothetical protein